MSVLRKKDLSVGLLNIYHLANKVTDLNVVLGPSISLNVCGVFISHVSDDVLKIPNNSNLLFCLLISGFLSSVSIKPMTTMLVFLRCGCGGVCGCGMLICFVSALGSLEMGRHKLPIIII